MAKLFLWVFFFFPVFAALYTFNFLISVLIAFHKSKTVHNCCIINTCMFIHLKNN